MKINKLHIIILPALLVILVFIFKNNSLHKKIENKNIYIANIKKEGSYIAKLKNRYNNKGSNKKMQVMLDSSGFDKTAITSTITSKKAHFKIDVKVDELHKIHTLSNKVLASSFKITSLSIKTKQDYNKTFSMDISF